MSNPSNSKEPKTEKKEVNIAIPAKKKKSLEAIQKELNPKLKRLHRLRERYAALEAEAKELEARKAIILGGIVEENGHNCSKTKYDFDASFNTITIVEKD